LVGINIDTDQWEAALQSHDRYHCLGIAAHGAVKVKDMYQY
jgi:hypothetical protein